MPNVLVPETDAILLSPREPRGSLSAEVRTPLRHGLEVDSVELGRGPIRAGRYLEFCVDMPKRFSDCVRDPLAARTTSISMARIHEA